MAQNGQNGPPVTAEKSSKKPLPGPTWRDLSDAARAFRGNPRGQSMHWDLFFPPMIGRSAPIAYLRARNLMPESSDILLVSHTGRRSGPTARAEQEFGKKPSNFESFPLQITPKWQKRPIYEGGRERKERPLNQRPHHSTRDPITINLGDEEAGTMLHAYVWASFVTAKSLEVVYFSGI